MKTNQDKIDWTILDRVEARLNETKARLNRIEAELKWLGRKRKASWWQCLMFAIRCNP